MTFDSDGPFFRWSGMNPTLPMPARDRHSVSVADGSVAGAVWVWSLEAAYD
ncbi:MAG: hypothetical protein WCF51_06160 [Nitrosomonadaceae bacterium]